MYHQIVHNKRASLAVVLVFTAVWVLIGALIGLISGGGASGAIGGGVIFLFLALAGALYSYFFGGATALAVAGARRADPTQYAQLHNIVEALAIGDGLPKPDVYVIDDASPNAFATGRDPRHAAVTVTSGLLGMMNREELEGVIAHEMSHIKNYDVRLLVLVTTLVAMAALIGSLLLRGAGTVRGRNSSGILLILLVAGLLLMALGYLIGPVMQFALSRERESLADASGVELTRNPAGLLSALRKLATNDQPLKTYNHATAAMYIDDPMQHHQSWFAHLFDTHPPIQERIAALERIAAVQQT
jgi:heat shock protein HtpX